jgi:hypothetical protein
MALTASDAKYKKNQDVISTQPGSENTGYPSATVDQMIAAATVALLGTWYLGKTLAATVMGTPDSYKTKYELADASILSYFDFATNTPYMAAQSTAGSGVYDTWTAGTALTPHANQPARISLNYVDINQTNNYGGLSIYNGTDWAIAGVNTQNAMDGQTLKQSPSTGAYYNNKPKDYEGVVGTVYDVGDVRVNGGYIYRCKTGFTDTGSWDESKWEKLPWDADVYKLPTGGIPKTDLAQAVQTSLTAADSALQPAAIPAGTTDDLAGMTGTEGSVKDLGISKANLQTAISHANSAYQLPSGGTTSEYLDGTGALRAFPAIPDISGLQDAITALTTRVTALEAVKYIIQEDGN